MRWRRGWCLLALGWLGWIACPLVVAAPSPEEAFARFWRATTPQEAAAAVEEITASGVGFEEALARLRQGRTYTAEVPKGLVQLTHHLGAYDFPYELEVPTTSDPGRRYQLRVQLHGGVTRRSEGPPRGNGIGALAGAEQIYVLPTAWADAPWWSAIQVENLRTILDSVKRTFNIDENRIVLSGASDGGTATYYFGMADITPYASFLPLIGSLAVLTNSSSGIEDELYPNNLVNKPFFIVNAGRDPLYPTAEVEPYINHLKADGVDVTYTPEPLGGHNTDWWPEVKESFEAFVRQHPRHPYPERLTWETDLAPGTARAHWLIIDELASAGRQQPSLPDVNDFARSLVGGRTVTVPLFFHRRPSGRVDLVRQGNKVTATTRGVKAFTLLLSPDVFDFSRPITVIADGRTVFDGLVKNDTPTLLKWAALDNDRTMLFGAELHLTLNPS